MAGRGLTTRMYAMTIVGGRGERLRPYTDNIPKAMVAINGRPLLAYQLDWMRANGEPKTYPKLLRNPVSEPHKPKSARPFSTRRHGRLTDMKCSTG